MFKTNSPNVQKLVSTRRTHLKKIQVQLRKISGQERERMKDLWDLHKELFSSEEEEATPKEMKVSSIDEYFEKSQEE